MPPWASIASWSSAGADTESAYRRSASGVRRLVRGLGVRLGHGVRSPCVDVGAASRLDVPPLAESAHGEGDQERLERNQHEGQNAQQRRGHGGIRKAGFVA